MAPLSYELQSCPPPHVDAAHHNLLRQSLSDDDRKIPTTYKSIDLGPAQHRFNLLHSAMAALLKLYPVGTLARHRSSMKITPRAEGFPIVISMAERGRTMLEFGGWHEDALRTSDIVSLVDKALAGKLRLIDERIGGKQSSHSIEILTGADDWQPMGSITYIRLFRNWRTRTATVQGFPRSKLNTAISVV